MDILGTSDIMKRWNYTRAGIRRLLLTDKSFPKPIGHINERKLPVFDLADIVIYEKSKPWLKDETLKSERKEKFWSNRHQEKT